MTFIYNLKTFSNLVKELSKRVQEVDKIKIALYFSNHRIIFRCVELLYYSINKQ